VIGCWGTTSKCVSRFPRWMIRSSSGTDFTLFALPNRAKADGSVSNEMPCVGCTRPSFPTLISPGLTSRLRPPRYTSTFVGSMTSPGWPRYGPPLGAPAPPPWLPRFPAVFAALHHPSPVGATFTPGTLVPEAGNASAFLIEAAGDSGCTAGRRFPRSVIPWQSLLGRRRSKYRLSPPAPNEITLGEQRGAPIGNGASSNERPEGQIEQACDPCRARWHRTLVA
jgi:hypothetical protein